MMEHIAPPADMDAVIAFHGHFCPGITTGYRAALIALKQLQVGRASDEELVAICETDACSLDAIQVITGCTMGKGNLILRDWGKQVFTIGRRGDTKMLRIALRYGLVPALDGQTPEQRRAATLDRLSHGRDEELFDIRWVDTPFPEPARVFHSVRCAQCGEGVMEARVRMREGQPLCPECFGEPYSRFQT